VFTFCLERRVQSSVSRQYQSVGLAEQRRRLRGGEVRSREFWITQISVTCTHRRHAARAGTDSADEEVTSDGVDGNGGVVWCGVVEFSAWPKVVLVESAGG
jgi:hypothetical protein